MFFFGRKNTKKEFKVKKIHLDEVESTNDYLKDYHDDSDMVIAVADYQTAGRGQGEHTWESESGKNLLFSILVHPGWIPVGRQFLLSMAEALALKDALDSYTDDITLKWPNDVYWKDRKISGTLIETSLDSHGIKNCVFGTGININQEDFHSDAPNPVSLFQILGKTVKREEVLDKVIAAFRQYYELMRSADYSDIAGLYTLALYRRKGYHWYEDKDGKFEGAFVEVEDDGHLIMHDRQGVIRRYTFGEIKFLFQDEK
jgi:BirA family biotin operon repressor/biotin-[acetyl-CoA-carboxylase] ligase